MSNFKVITEAVRYFIKEDRRTFVEEIEVLQGTVSQFGSSKECKAYNNALADVTALVEARGEFDD